MSGPEVVVVGGGIAGLGAARTLTQHGLDVLVLEREGEAGGRMRSRQGFDGIWFDIGAEHLTSRDVPFVEMLDEFGIADQKVHYLASESGTAFQIYRGGKSYELDMVRPHKFFTYGAISPWGRAQILRILPTMLGQMRRNHRSTFEPWRAAPIDDQSMEQWLGRIAPEFLEYAMEPMWDIVCGWDPADVSRGFLVYIMTAYRNATGFTLSKGLGALTRELAARLDVRTGTLVHRVDVAKHVVECGPVDGGPRERLEPDAVLVATPGHKVRGIVDNIDAERAAFFAGVRYQAHDNCYFKLNKKADELDLPDRGFYPRREHGELAGIGYTQVPTAPDRKVLRTGLKGRFSTEFAHRPDQELEAAIMQRVSEVAPEIPPLVEDRFLARWDAALPIFYPGYLRALERFHSLEPLPGVAFAGDYLSLCATAAAYDSGQRAAGQILADLGRG
jgi:oxygen-dependent protoporphyrinogen oxidase